MHINIEIVYNTYKITWILNRKKKIKNINVQMYVLGAVNKGVHFNIDIQAQRSKTFDLSNVI